MTHLFKVEIANLHGIEIAIMVQNFAFWIAKNKANNRNIHEGKTWTYNSIKSFKELYPYWTEHQIRRILKKMKTEDILMTGNFNNHQYDRTTWYTFTDAFLQNHKSIFTNVQMEVDDMPNGNEQRLRPIPDNKPSSLPVEKQNINIGEVDYQSIVDYYHSSCPSLPKVAKLSDKRKNTIKSLLKDFTDDEIKRALDKVEKSAFLVGSDGGWKASFDWMMNKNNLLKVLEGNYDAKRKHKASKEGYDLDLEGYLSI